MNTFINYLTLSDYNVKVVVFSVVLLGIASAIIGCFTFLQKKALIGDAVAHSILPGVCFAFIISGSKNIYLLLLGAFISGWISILLSDWIQRNSKTKPSTTIGIVLSLFFGLGIILLTHIQYGNYKNKGGLESFLFGKAAGLQVSDLYLILIVFLFIIIVVFINIKQLKIYIFDPLYANSIGLKTKRIQFLINSLIILSISIGIQSVGVVLMAALLITPAAAARFWTNKLESMIIVSSVFGMIASYSGTFVSYYFTNSPTGPWIVITLSTIALVSFIIAPKKGLLYKNLEKKRNSNLILTENILKACYHILENDMNLSITKKHILNKRYFSSNELKRGLKYLKAKKLLNINSDDIITLTELGLLKSKRIVRLHRLWEIYLTKKMNFASDHVHGNAETIEHIITPEIELELLKELNFPNKDPHNKILP